MVIEPALLRVVLSSVYWAALVWAVGVLVSPWLPSDPFVIAAIAGVPYAIVDELTDRDGGAARRVTSEALRLHQDPGPAHRQAVDERARDLLRPALRWFVRLTLLLAAACLVVAAPRGDGWAAVPGVLLLVLMALLVRRVRVMRHQASRWLDHPPYAQVQES